MNYPTELTIRLGAPNVVLCGSFRRQREALLAAYDRLVEAGATVISPADLNFVKEEQGFVFAEHEAELQPAVIEERHLEAMRQADFIWLHAPDGYVGRSAAMELGFAHGQGLAVYGSTSPIEPAFAALVRVVPSPEAAVAACSPQGLASNAPTTGLRALQAYYAKAAALRGWSHETATETLRLLSGEVEELSEALQRTAEMRKPVDGEEPDLELADVALYVFHLANALDVDLGGAISEKEKINADRFHRVSTLAA